MPRIAFVLLLAATTTACLRSTTVVSIRPDGTGTIVQEMGVSPQALAMLKSMASAGEQNQGAPPEIFGEEQAKKAAATMGVTFVSGEPIKTAQMDGYRANFSFDDVRKLQVKMSQDPTAGLAGGKGASDPPFGFGFERRGESAILTITMPDEKPAGIPGMGPGMGMGGANTSPEQNAQAIQMMKMMMQGLFVDVSLNIDGRILKTNAPHVDGSRLTLLQLDFDKLLADEAGLLKLQSATDIKSLGNVAGLKVITDRKVTVEFSK
jgi:hypothetical protein